MRKKPLLRNEIEMLQIILEDKAFPTKEYRLKLIGRLEDLKSRWYKVKLIKKEKYLCNNCKDECDCHMFLGGSGTACPKCSQSQGKVECQ